MDNLISELPDMFDNFTVHPSGAVYITHQGESALVVPSKYTYKVVYGREGEPLAYRTIAGMLGSIKDDLLRWRERES